MTETMRTIQIGQYGGPEVLVPAEVPIPSPGPGEVLVRIAYAGLNFIDVYTRKGLYARSETYGKALPLVIGMEAAGTIAAIGEGIEDLSIGDRVAYCLVMGSYAVYAVVPAWRVVKTPAELPLEVAAALMLQGGTAHYLTTATFPLASGQSCLVHAAAGGVGQLLVQMAKIRGARVFATVGTPEKAEIARGHGADAVILYRDVDFRQAVMRLTEGRGVDVVYDSVGQATIADSIRSVRRRGLCVLFGAASGPVASIEPIALAEAGSIFFTRPHQAHYQATREEIVERYEELFRLVREGRLAVTIFRVYPLADVAAAHRALENRETRGKVLLKVAD